MIVLYLSFCIFIVLIVILIDVIPMARDWMLRIHMGKCTCQQDWNELITGIGKKWLLRTPKIKVTDNTRLIVIDMLKGNYTKRAIQHWQEASLLLGLAEHLKNTDDEETKQALQRYMRSTFTPDGQWIRKPEHVDAGILAYAIMKLGCIDPDAYKAALDEIWECIQSHIGMDGTVGYRKSMHGYRYVDTIGFICPFLIAYGTRYNKPECIELGIKQIREYERFGMLQVYHIPSHAYVVDKQIPLGLYGWGRGLGWYAIGLIDAWNELPQDHAYKPVLENSVKAFARAVLPFQQNNGSWSWSVTRSETRPDSSATATLAWFLLNASSIDEISQEALEGANKAIRFLMSVTRRNGAVDFSQGDTKDIGVYSLLFNILPFTQGFCIRSINKLDRTS